jgi:hypothetical protein
MTRRRAWVLAASLALLDVGVALSGACSLPASPSGDTALCNSPTGACTDGSTIVGLASGYTVPAQYGSSCTSGTYYPGPPSAWAGTCGSSIFVLCVGGTWSGAYCGDYLPDGWELLGPDGGLVADAAADSGADGGSTDGSTSDGSADGGRSDAQPQPQPRDGGGDADAKGEDGSADARHEDAREHDGSADAGQQG